MPAASNIGDLVPGDVEGIAPCRVDLQAFRVQQELPVEAPAQGEAEDAEKEEESDVDVGENGLVQGTAGKVAVLRYQTEEGERDEEHAPSEMDPADAPGVTEAQRLPYKVLYQVRRGQAHPSVLRVAERVSRAAVPIGRSRRPRPLEASG